MVTIRLVGCSAVLLGLGLPALVPAEEPAIQPVAGIAGRYVGDAGIAADEQVVFVEDFEVGDVAALGSRWETVRDPGVMSFSADIPVGSGGQRSLLMSQRQELGTGSDLYRRLGTGYERLYTRMYVKFAEDCEPVHHFGTCVGGNHPSTPWPTVKAGQPPLGDRGFWVGIEPFGRQWQWDYYAYWCEMRGSPPRGQTWGNSFCPRRPLEGPPWGVDLR